MSDIQKLKTTLESIDGKGYKAYKKLQGNEYRSDKFALIIDHVQGDPFASPSRLRVRVPQSVAGFPEDTYSSQSRETALRDYLARKFSSSAGKASRSRGSGASGTISIDSPGQEILERTAVFVNREMVEARFTAGLPAKGRRVLGKQAAVMLTEIVPQIVTESLLYSPPDRDGIYTHIRTAEDAAAIRKQLGDKNLVTFVADGSVLPRRSGIDDRPMEDGAVPFRSPDSLSVTLQRPNGGEITGMGIPAGVTLITGGGYHGKSTLLRAIETGIYDHIPGDGREFIVTDPGAVKIRAEDGRSVTGVGISPFISDLPGGVSTKQFTTENASGSTSQAANIMEMLEAGSTILLIDEDTSATNFMIRDHRMQELVSKDKEPITPLVDKIRQLYSDLGVSSVLVMGGSGDYFEHADTVIAMEEFTPRDVTGQAKEIAGRYKTGRDPEGGDKFGDITSRIPAPESIDPSKGKRGINIKTRGKNLIQFGSENIDLSQVEQIVDGSQTRAIAEALLYMKKHCLEDGATVSRALDSVEDVIRENGLDALKPGSPGNLARFRRFELAAALNRLRSLKVNTIG